MLLAGLPLKQTMTLTSNCRQLFPPKTIGQEFLRKTRGYSDEAGRFMNIRVQSLLAPFNDFLLDGGDSPVSYEGLIPQTSKLL